MELLFNFVGDLPADTPIKSGAVVLTVPAKVASKQCLMAVYKQGLGCPWFGANWDALYDAMRDLSWLGDKDLVIEHVDLPFGEKRRSRILYFSLLQDALEDWQLENPAKLTVRIPAKYEGWFR
jgi:Barstar (barnase inhibitor)